MAKKPQPTIRKGPRLEAFVSGDTTETMVKTAKAQNPPLPSKQRLSVTIPADVLERARAAVYWTPGLTLAGLAETALGDALKRLEKKHGKPFDPIPGERLPGGRPVGR